MTMTRRRPTGSHYLYVISNGFDHCKIGHSRAPKGRLSELQVGTHQKLRLERTWKLTIEDAKGDCVLCKPAGALTSFAKEA